MKRKYEIFVFHLIQGKNLIMEVRDFHLKKRFEYEGQKPHYK